MAPTIEEEYSDGENDDNDDEDEMNNESVLSNYNRASLALCGLSVISGKGVYQSSDLFRHLVNLPYYIAKYFTDKRRRVVSISQPLSVECSECPFVRWTGERIHEKLAERRFEYSTMYSAN